MNSSFQKLDKNKVCPLQKKLVPIFKTKFFDAFQFFNHHQNQTEKYLSNSNSNKLLSNCFIYSMNQVETYDIMKQIKYSKTIMFIT